MRKPRILVTGATGKTGRLVVSESLNAGYPVRVIVHREDIRSARLKAQGVEVAVADMSDVERIAGALNDIQSAYYCPPFDPHMIQGATAFAVAAKESRLEQCDRPGTRGFRIGTSICARIQDLATRTRCLWSIRRPSASTGRATRLMNP